MTDKEQLKHLDTSISICEAKLIKQVYGDAEFNKTCWELQKYLIHREVIKMGGDIESE
jgi:hypothetical protein